METPDVVRLLGSEVVINKRPIVIVENESVLGTYLESKTEIQIRNNLSPSAQRNTVLHELIHAILQEYEQDSEELVRILTPALLAMLRDNPALVEFLTT